MRVKAINPGVYGGSRPSNFANINGTLFFYRLALSRGQQATGYADIAVNDALGEPLPGTALVMGAGGAARAAVWALARAGVDVTVWSRTPERAAGLGCQRVAAPVHHPEVVRPRARLRHDRGPMG